MRDFSRKIKITKLVQLEVINVHRLKIIGKKWKKNFSR